MASIKERRNKNGVITSYTIIVCAGSKSDGRKATHNKTVKYDPKLSASKNRKIAEKIAVEFEESFENGFEADSKETVASYCDYVIHLKEKAGLATSTVNKYKKLSVRVKDFMGDLLVREVTPKKINSFYDTLTEAGEKQTKSVAIVKRDLYKLIQDRKLTRQKFAMQAGISQKTLQSCIEKNTVSIETAEKIAAALNMRKGDLFKEISSSETLSAKTLTHYHSFLHIVFDQAFNDMIIKFNPVDRCTPPKSKDKSQKAKVVDTLQTDELQTVLQCAATEPLTVRIIIELLVATGCRRSELCALKWENLNMTTGRLRIDRQLEGTGSDLHEKETKTGQMRDIKIGSSTLFLLRRYKQEQEDAATDLKDHWTETPYILKNSTGNAITPAALSSYITRFEKKHNLPFHIHAHMFRHTTASVLIHEGYDTVSTAHWLGHTQVSTTLNIYAGFIDEANDTGASILDTALHGSNQTDDKQVKQA